MSEQVDEFGHDAAYWVTRHEFVQRKALERLVRDEERRRIKRRMNALRRDWPRRWWQRWRPW